MLKSEPDLKTHVQHLRSSLPLNIGAQNWKIVCSLSAATITKQNTVLFHTPE